MISMKKQQSYFCDLYQPEVSAEPVWCYRTGMAVYEEVLHGGRLCSGGWNAAGYPLNVLSNCPSRLDLAGYADPGVFALELDGMDADLNLTCEGVEQRPTDTGTEVRLRLRAAARPVAVTVVTRLDGTDGFSRHLELENLSDAPVAVSHVAPFAGALETMEGLHSDAMLGAPAPEELYDLGYMDSDGGIREGDFAWHPLHPDGTVVEGRYARERHRAPLAVLRNRILGTTLLLQLAWSGGFAFSFDLNVHNEADRSLLACRVSLTGPSPALILQPGEHWVSPAVHLAFVHGGLDEAVNAMNAHLRRSVLRTDGRSCLVGGGMGPEHDMSVATSKRFIDQLAAMGAEVFIIDAGWYCPPGKEMTEWWTRVGDWHADPDRYPDGIGELRDYCHAKGMKFGMWMESERLGTLSAMRKEHPDWITTHTDGTPSDSFIDMTDPAAAAWVKSEIARVITEYGIELFRVDYNVSAAELFTLREGRECAAVRHVQAVYKMYQELKAQFPDVIFENCAGGGGRCDLGMLAAFNHSWVSDNQVAPRSLAITNGMTVALPPERVDRLVSGMGCHRTGELALQMRNAMFGHISLNVLDPRDAVWNPDQLEFIRRSVQLYKDFIRPMLPDALIWHPTPEAAAFGKGQPMVLQLSAPDGSRAVLGAFSAAGTVQTVLNVRPQGLDAACTYRVTLDNTGAAFTMTGAALQQSGLRLQLPAALCSELVLFERI